MKRLFYLLLLTLGCVSLTACSDDDDKDDTIKIAKDQKEQSAYADETGRTINFTATEAWSTAVKYTSTRAEETDEWVTLDPPSGEAGDVTISVTLGKNFTGKNRRAEITIICGDTRVTVIIEQDGKTEDGEIPSSPGEPEAYKKLISKIEAKVTMYEHETYSYTARLVFEYDDRNRVVSEKTYDDEGIEQEWAVNYTYSENTITSEDEGEKDKYIYTLNKDGNVESWTNIYNNGELHDMGKLVYDENGYFISSSSEYQGDSTDKNSERAEWKDGNLVKVVDNDNGTTTVEYGNLPNRMNLDLNYLFANTEWLGCMAFEGTGIKHLGYIGKRSANLMTKETETADEKGKPGYEYVYTYQTDNDGLVVSGTYTGYREDGSKEEYTEYTITYIDAK